MKGHAPSGALVLTGFLAILLVLSACGSPSGTPVASSDSSTTATVASPSTSTTMLEAKSTCPLSAATVSAITGVRVYEESSAPTGSCAFDSIRGGSGLGRSEVRVNIETGTDNLGSLYSFFSQQAAKGLPACQPFRLIRRTDLGPGGFETLCGATATAGPSSVDDYLPLQDHKALTVTVNRGVAVRGHRLVTCEAQTAAVVKAIRSSW